MGFVWANELYEPTTSLQTNSLTGVSAANLSPSEAMRSIPHDRMNNNRTGERPSATEESMLLNDVRMNCLSF
jgi:hypothetical protein